MDPASDDECPTLIALDESDPTQDKPEENQQEEVPPFIGKQFERQVPVTLITGYLGMLLTTKSAFCLYKSDVELETRNTNFVEVSML